MDLAIQRSNHATEEHAAREMHVVNAFSLAASRTTFGGVQNAPGAARSLMSAELAQTTVTRLIKLVFAAAVFGSLGPGSLAAEDEESEALLDEIVAGSEANLAMFQSGIASYRAIRTTYSYSDNQRRQARGRGSARATKSAVPGGKQGPFDSEYTVYFDYPRLRLDWRGTGVVRGNTSAVVEECYIRDAERLITYNMPQFYAQQTAVGDAKPRTRAARRGTSNPNAHNVVIDRKSQVRRWVMHPRQQIRDFSVAEEVARLRADSEASLVAVQERDGLIRYDVRCRGYNAKRWVSPALGYCVVKAKLWDPDLGESNVLEEYEATARDGGGGAYVIDHAKMTDSVNLGDTILPHTAGEVTLVSIDLATPPDGKLFTIESFDLPAGAQIVDRVEGRKYKYAVAAVKERDVTVPPVSGPMKGRGWAVAIYIVAGIALVGVGFVSHRIQKRRRSSVGSGGSGIDKPV